MLAMEADLQRATLAGDFSQVAGPQASGDRLDRCQLGLASCLSVPKIRWLVAATVLSRLQGPTASCLRRWQLGATRAARAAELCTHLQDYVEKEKAELARRLHDELGGLLTAAKMDLSWLQSRMEDASMLRQRLDQLGNVLDEAMDLKRRVVEELRPSLLDHFGLPTALRAHVESVCSKAGLDCEVALEDAMESVSREDTAIALFRVIEEGLDNIVRHAQAKQVRIEIAARPATCTCAPERRWPRHGS